MKRKYLICIIFTVITCNSIPGVPQSPNQDSPQNRKGENRTSKDIRIDELTDEIDKEKEKEKKLRSETFELSQKSLELSRKIRTIKRKIKTYRLNNRN